MTQQVTSAEASASEAPARIPRLTGAQLWRWGRVFLGAWGLGAALWFVAKRTILSYSTMAIAAPSMKTIRAPISGFLSLGNSPDDRTFDKGSLIATVEDPLVDDSLLREMEAKLLAVNTERQALLVGQKELESAKGAYGRAGESYRRERVVQLNHASEEAERLVALHERELAYAKARLERITELRATGVESEQGLETANRDYLVKTEQLGASRERLEALRRAVSALQRGVDVGVLDGTPNQTLADNTVKEVSLRLLDSAKELALHDAEQSVLTEKLKPERERIARLKTQTITAQQKSRVVRVSAQDGEFVSRGQELFRVSQCDDYVVIAYVSESTFNRLKPDGPAVLKMHGSGERFEGVIKNLIGPFSTNGGSFLNMDAQAYDGAERFQVELEFPALSQRYAQHCRSGTTGEVYFPGAFWKPTW